MHHLTSIPCSAVELVWNHAPGGGPMERARQLRGALVEAANVDALFHQHDEDGRHLYRYPRVHYRWWRDRGMVVGWGEAAARVLELKWLDLELRLGQDALRATDVFMHARDAEFGVSDILLHYQLNTPILLFNQDNYRRYKSMNPHEQRLERDRLLRAQILTALRGLGVEFELQLYVTFSVARPTRCHFKRQELLGIEGELVCNAVLPPFFAAGHAVSHGFGWMSLLEDE